MTTRLVALVSAVFVLVACDSGPPQRPDLAADMLTVAPVRVIAGQAATISFNLRNLGSRPAGAFSYAVSLTGLDGGAPVALTTRSVPSLGAGVTEGQTFSATVPVGTPPGAYTLTVVLDPEGQIDEADEGNNTVASTTPVTIARPGSDVNLIPSNVALSVTTALPFDTVTVTYDLRNAGTDGVLESAGVKTQFYLSADSQYSPDDVRIGEQPVGAVPASGTRALSATVTVPGDITAGTYTLLVVVDGAAVLPETNEDDNIAGAPLQIESGRVTGVDLVVTELTASPTSVPRGGGTTVRFSILNRGDTAIETSFFNRLFLARSLTVNPETDTILLAVNVPSLGAGEAMSFEHSVVIPASVNPGRYFLAVIADPSNRIAETNEQNNVRVDTTGLTVTPPATSDVVAENVTLSGLPDGATVAAGTNVTVNFALGNNGPDASGSITASIVLSADTTQSADDRVLGTVSVPNLSSGQTQTFTETVTVPTDIDNRRWFVGVVADPDERLVDPNRANNAAFEPQGFIVSGASGCTDDDFEPNDARASARAISPGFHGNLYLCSGNEDWYTIGVPQGSSVKVSMTSSASPEPDFDLELYEPGANGQRVDSSFGGGATEEVGASFVTVGGDYVLRVRPFSGSGPYALTITVTPAGGNGIDLVPLDLGVPGATHADPGESFPVQFEVRNVGTVDSPDFSFELSLIPADTGVCPNAVSLGVFSSAALPSNQRRTVSQMATIPVGTCIGEYFVRVVLDPANEVAETFDDNNTVTTVTRFAVGGFGGCVDDEMEPNDNRLQARAIAPGSYPSLKLCRDDDDWYSVFLAQGERLEVLLEFTDADGDLDLALTDEGGTTLTSSTGITDTERVTYTATAAGRVLIHVWGIFSGSQNGNPYRMTVTGGAGVDLAVKDLSVSPARQLAGEDVSVRFAVENLLPLGSTPTTAEVRFRSGATETLARSVEVPPLGATTSDGPRKAYDLKFPVPTTLAPGTYDVVVVVDPTNAVREGSETNNSAVVAGFQVLMPCSPDAWEPNDGIAEATDVTPPAGTTQTSLSNASICPGDVDYFEITVGSGETRDLTAQITFAHAMGDLDLFLYRRDAAGGLTELARSTGNADNEQISRTGLTEGTYLLKVVGFNGATNTYGLQVTLAPAP